MNDVSTRAYAEADLPAITELYNLVDVAAGSYAGHIEEETRAMISSMVRDTESDSRLLFAPDGTLVAAAFVPTPPPGGHRIDLFGAVHPQWRGQGIGRDLLGWQIERAGRIHRDVAPDAIWNVHVGVLATDEPSMRLYQRLGLTPTRYWFEMVTGLDDVPVLPIPDGLRVDAYRPEYEKALHQAHMDAFVDHWGYQWRDLEVWRVVTIDLDVFRPDLSRVIFDGDEIAGYVLSYDHTRAGWLYVGQVGTRRAWRGRGLATGLLSDLLRAAGALGKTNAALGVDADSPTGAVGVYERVGFTVSERAVTYVRQLNCG